MPSHEDSDVFLTPLKRLPGPLNTPVSFLVPYTTPVKPLTANQTPKRYQLQSLARAPIPTKINQQDDLSNSTNLQPLNDIQILKLSQSIPHRKLVDDDVANGKKPPIVYYKPPTATSQYGFKNLLPPTPSGQFKYPIITTAEPPKQDVDGDYPTGDWFNPVVKVALSRQINKEQYFRKFAVNLVLYICFKLVQAVANYVVVVIDANFGNTQESKYRKIINDLESQNGWAYGVPLRLVLRGVEVIFLLNIVYCGYNLLKKQDQCLDLPLSNKQRQLLGLEANDHFVNEDEKERDQDRTTNLLLKQRQFVNSQPNGDSVTLPKYSTSNQYRKTEAKPRPIKDNQLEKSIELDTRHSLGLYNRKIITSKGLALVVDKPVKISEKTQEKFYRKYNIEMNVSDDDRVETTNILASLTN